MSASEHRGACPESAAADRGAVPGDAETRARIIASTDKSMLVEAAAGTGKTTLIVDRIIQGIRDGTLRLPATVAITFTEKAAGELESRVRSRLAEELRRTDRTSPSDLAAEERARLESAVEELDRANISTIHSFCARILREKSAEAGVDPEFSVLEQTQAEILRRRAWREWMGVQASQAPADREDAKPAPLVEALRAGVGVNGLSTLADALANAPEILDSPEFVLPTPAQSREELTETLCERAGRAAHFCQEHMRGSGNVHSRALCRLAQDVAAAAPAEPNTMRRKAYAVLRVPVDKALTSFAREKRDEARRVLSEFGEAAAGLGAHLARDVFDWLAGFVEYYREAKQARSVLDFQDLLLLAARMLRDNLAVRRYFQHRFDAFFVDEFQDTDPLQAELIAYLCENMSGPQAPSMGRVKLADGKLFAVGDPKQSIYRFRRADVQIYDRFKGLFGSDTFGEERVELIFCNFRSVPRLLDWLNRLFVVLLGQPVGEGVYQAAHVPLAPPAPSIAEGSGGPAVVALCPPTSLPAADWRAPAARRYEARYLARVVREAVDGNLALPGCGEFAYADFAFLFRALTDVTAYEEALDEYGVPYRVIGGKHFYQREHTVETLAVLRAVEDPLDEAAIVGALRSSFFGVSDEELFRYKEGGGSWNYTLTEVKSGPAGEATVRLAEWHRVRNRVPPHVLLRRIFAETKAQQAFLLKPAGEQRVANLEKLLNQLRSIGAAGGTFGSVVRYLSSVHEAELPEEESSVVEPGDDFVRLLTMHKAKGLEFEVVVLPDLARPFASLSAVSPLVFNRLDGRVGVRIGPGLRSGNYDELAAEEHGNELAEQRRLLYVACTRARRLLMPALYWQRKQNRDCLQKLLQESGCFAGPDDVPFGQERQDVYYLDTSAWVAEMDVAPKPSWRAEEPEADVEDLLRERKVWLESHERLALRASEGEPFVLPSSLEAGFELRHLPEESASGAGGTGFGSLFHNLMRVAPLEPGGCEDMEQLLRNLAAIEADELGLDGGAAEEAAGLALQALANPEFRALVQGAEVLEKEVGFSVPLTNLPVCAANAAGFLEGSIDLLVTAPGRTIILDYKTDRFPARDRLAVEARYWPQLALYGLAAQECGCAGPQTELALFFVRTGAISRRTLDAELTEHAEALVAQALAGRGE